MIPNIASHREAAGPTFRTGTAAEGWPQTWRLVEAYRYDYQECAGWTFAGLGRLFAQNRAAIWVRRMETPPDRGSEAFRAKIESPGSQK